MFTILDLLHPHGGVCDTFVIGGNCPEALRPEPPKNSAARADLIILAPTRKELMAKRWLLNAVQSIPTALTENGLVYLLAPPEGRSVISRFLQKIGLQADISFVHVPNWSSSEFIIPLTNETARYAFSTLIPLPPIKRFLAGLWFQLPGADWLLGYLWPSAGLVFRRPGARPLFEWLYGNSDISLGTALIRSSWQGRNGPAILYCFREEEREPFVIAKVCPPYANVCDQQEGGLLARLGPLARSAGARVPEPVISNRNTGQEVILQTIIRGHPAAEILRQEPEQLGAILEQVSSWLEEWQKLTVRYQPAGMNFLERTLLDPARQLAPFLEHGEAYLSWLSSLCRQLVGVKMPFVATHDDLTMANVLIERNERLGVVDWEMAHPDNWPLVDLVYALTDAVRIARRYTDRLDAFKTCFEPGGSYSLQAARLQTRLVSNLMISQEAIELSFHACWLHHARNEYQKNQPEDSQPFFRILQWLVLNTLNRKASVVKA